MYRVAARTRQLSRPWRAESSPYNGAADGRMATGLQKDLARRRILWRREVALTLAGLVVTVLATLLLTLDMAGMVAQSMRAGALGTVLTQIGFGLIFLGLIYGNILYQLTRLGYWLRLRTPRATPRHVLDTVYDEPAPPAVVMLGPSYKEEVSVVRQALLSCALQEYPHRRVVLLIDDPYPPATAADWEALERMRHLPQEIMALLAAPAARCHAAAARFEARLCRQPLEVRAEIARLVDALEEVARWCEAQATIWAGPTHTDALFVALTFVERARQERRRAAALARALPALQGAALTQRLRREYRRLACLFRVQVTSFERKRYANLSHAPNKAMNLNSYLGLLGKSWRETRRGDQLMLWETTPACATCRRAG